MAVIKGGCKALGHTEGQRRMDRTGNSKTVRKRGRQWHWQKEGHKKDVMQSETLWRHEDR
jgi:hypothetical protein